MASRQLDEERIFHIARKLQEVVDRNDYLDQICAGDQALRDRVEALLNVHLQEQQFLKSAKPGLASTAGHAPIPEGPGAAVGRYKLLQQLGEGGMGTVFMAEQSRPVSRRVALKIIKPGMDSMAVIARFEAERQALAMMDHPNIAKVLDAGATETGRPYFVMELVKGVPISEYCDDNRLTIRQRLGLFIEVCKAVQHAHQKGIIHRDIKPSNVLVALYDGKPVPKIIDFGVAKAISQRLTERTMFTQFGQIVGTLEYMSPEQAQFNQLDVDTRSDIYSLGVLLYELLTGAPPLDRQRLNTMALEELLRAIREEDAPKPSMRISSCQTLPALAAQRQVEPERLCQLVRGELDWILMKALDKDRSRRYETASALAEDVEHHLRDEPVTACPPSTFYMLGKVSRKHRTLLRTASLVAAALLLGLFATTWLWGMATRAAERESNIAVELQEKVTELQRQRIKLAEAHDELCVELQGTILIAVMSGDKVKAEAAIQKAQRVGVAPSWIRIFEGLLALHSGKLDDALHLLREARDMDPESVAANALLAFACEYAGHGREYGEILVKLKRMNPEPGNVYDRLFKASNDEIYDTRESVRELGALVDEYPSWGLARVMLASAVVEHAWNTGDLRDARRALVEIGVAEKILPEMPLLLAKKLMAALCALELASPDSSEREQWLADADDAAKKLEENYPNCAPRELTAYYVRRRDDIDRAINILRDARKAGAGEICESFLAALLFRTGRFEEMKNSKFGWWGLFEVQDNAKALDRLCRNLKSEDALLDVPDIWARTVLYTCGEREAAKRAWKRLLDDNPDASWNFRDPMELFTGRLTPEALLDRANKSAFGFRVSFAHFCIAVKALALDGNRETARKHFEECLRHPVLRVDIYYWTQAFLERMKDPDWPRWAALSNADTTLPQE